MKKIIVVFESIHYNDEIFHFVKALHSIEPVSLTAVFLSPVDVTSIWAFPVVPGSSKMNIVPGSEEADELLKKHIQNFSKNCEEAGINYNIHNDVNGVVFEQVKIESRFADLMLIHTGLFYADFGEQP